MAVSLFPITLIHTLNVPFAEESMINCKTERISSIVRNGLMADLSLKLRLSSVKTGRTINHLLSRLVNKLPENQLLIVMKTEIKLHSHRNSWPGEITAKLLIKKNASRPNNLTEVFLLKIRHN